MAEEHEISPLEKKVAEQIEYYFGDHNLPRDRFLKEQMQLDDGWVSLETMLKFNRLKSLTTDATVIVKSLQKSKTGLLEISEDQNKIRRCLTKPLPELNDEYRDAVKHRSIYMKGFPLDTTLDEVKEWLAEKGAVENIHMRKGPQKTFKGSIFAVLNSEDAAKAFVMRDDVKQFKGNDMLVLMREDYSAKKAEEKKQCRVQSKAKAKSEKEENLRQSEAEEMKALVDQRGCVLKFSGELGQTSREDFHSLFSEHAQIKWINFIRGAQEGTILFRSSAEEALQKAREAGGGTELKVNDREVQWEVLEGDAEMEMLKKIIESQQESLNKNKFKGGKAVYAVTGGHKGRGRGRGGRRDRGGRDQLRFQGKKTKFDSDDEEAGESVDAEPAASKKRALDSNGTDTDGPAPKQAKEETC
ncbi:lupus La protein isoform X1 [Electrophorus electricus]|uniref:lupus La protein isoform X1 n=1 Tax=Electrophorus electricus TaxID=8005 RepID=UPI000F09F00D|nr:lupus La protein isoform X1 [Electrophorus electricus]